MNMMDPILDFTDTALEANIFSLWDKVMLKIGSGFNSFRRKLKKIKEEKDAEQKKEDAMESIFSALKKARPGANSKPKTLDQDKLAEAGNYIIDRMHQLQQKYSGNDRLVTVDTSEAESFNRSIAQTIKQQSWQTGSEKLPTLMILGFNNHDKKKSVAVAGLSAGPGTSPLSVGFCTVLYDDKMTPETIVSKTKDGSLDSFGATLIYHPLWSIENPDAPLTEKSIMIVGNGSWEAS